ncbi:MAG TPA: hypothetical protein VHI93_00285 [Candidatus Thermoplasmatota archaeon]|nr:hypothetical protein [Candidatus Thermoplasmatota archaeon]
MARRPPGPLLALLLLTLGPAAAQPESIGVSPGRVEVQDAQPGQSYHASVTVQNQYGTPTTFTVERNGTVGGWTATDPVGPFIVPARSAQQVRLAITPPSGTGPGERTGELRFTTQPRGSPDGSGASIASRVAVVLRVAVGGEARPHVTWLGAGADDVREGEALRVRVEARNDGNVRTVARAHASVAALAGGPVLAEADGQAEPEPGQVATVVVDVGDRLPAGQYLVRVASAEPPGFNATLDVKVIAAGASAADGRLRAILNAPRVPVGEPMAFEGWFENTGKVPIAGARLFATVLRDGQVVAQLSGGSEAVPAGASVNLTVVWAPAAPGLHTLVGHVEYDGYRTPEVEGRVEVAAPGGVPGWLLVGGGIALLAGVGAWAWGRRRVGRQG